MENADFIKLVETLRDCSKMVELSYTMEDGMPYWPTQPQYQATVLEEAYDTGGSFHREIRISEHTGTHIDAPRHFIRGAASVDQLGPGTVMGRGVVIHAENIAPCETLPLAQIKAFEAENGEIRAGDVIMIRFGWEDKYAVGEDKGFLRDWPGLSGEAAQYLADKNVAAVGCDTLALDSFTVERYVCHEILLSAPSSAFRTSSRAGPARPSAWWRSYHKPMGGC